MIYLDNAATTSPKPKSVVFAVSNALKNFSANPGRGGHTLSMNTAEAVYNARKKVAGFFGAEAAENVIFTPSCTYALNFALKGLLKKGDHVIASPLEHNAVMRPLEALKLQGIEVSIADYYLTEDGIVKSFESKIKANTKAVVCTHASNVFGNILPIEKIGAMCKKHGIAFIVDAAQTAGKLPISVKTMNIDFLCVAAHKGLYAPMGTGILIASRDLIPIIEGGTGNNSRLFTQPVEMPERLESGTMNVPGILGLSAGIDFVMDTKMNNIYTHELKLVTALFDGLSHMNGVLLYTEIPKKGESAAVLSFNIKDIPSEEVAEALSGFGIATRAGLHCAPAAHGVFGTLSQGTVRMSPSVFTGTKDINKTLEFIDFFVKKH